MTSEIAKKITNIKMDGVLKASKRIQLKIQNDIYLKHDIAQMQEILINYNSLNLKSNV